MRHLPALLLVVLLFVLGLIEAAEWIGVHVLGPWPDPASEPWPPTGP